LKADKKARQVTPGGLFLCLEALCWPAASASGVVLMVATLTVMAISQSLVRRTQRLAPEEPSA